MGHIDGTVRCTEFPLIVMTSNKERDFPPAFLRRCLQLEIEHPNAEQLAKIVEMHLGSNIAEKAEEMIKDFVKRRNAAGGDIATDQLLNAIYITNQNIAMSDETEKKLIDILLRSLGTISG